MITTSAWAWEEDLSLITQGLSPEKFLSAPADYFWVLSGVQWIKSPLLANFINRIKNFLCIIDNVSVYLEVKINVQLSAIPTYNMINQDKQLFLSVAFIFQPLAGAAVKRGPGPSPPYSITSWNYCCKTNVKVSFGDYNPSHWANHIFNTPALHIVATSAQEVEDEPGKQEYDSTPYHIASARLLLLLL